MNKGRTVFWCRLFVFHVSTLNLGYRRELPAGSYASTLEFTNWVSKTQVQEVGSIWAPAKTLAFFVIVGLSRVKPQINETCSSMHRTSFGWLSPWYHPQGWNPPYVCPSNKPFIDQEEKRKEPPIQFSEMPTQGTHLPGIINQGFDTSLLEQVDLSWSLGFLFLIRVHGHQLGHAAKFCNLPQCPGVASTPASTSRGGLPCWQSPSRDVV